MAKTLRFTMLVLALAWPGASGAATQTILGKTLLVKDPQPGVDASRRKIVAMGKELASPDTVAGDPIANGATIEIVANGATSGTQSFSLPAGAAPAGGPGWKALGSPPIGYQYKDGAGVNGPVKLALIKKTPGGVFILKVVIMGALGPGPQPHITVLPPNPGTDGGMIFTITGGDTYCVTLGGAAGGLAVNNANKLFKVNAKDTNPTTETGCPVPSASTTTSSTTSTTTITVPTTTVSFSAHVQPILSSRCAIPGCHTGAFPAQGLDLSAGQAYASLNPGVKFSTECPTKHLVEIGDPAASYMFQKLQGSGPGCFVGTQMPQIGGPLNASEMNTISTWIMVGAPNN